jgi:death on curing protein
VDVPIWVTRVAVEAMHLDQLREHGGLQGVRNPNGFEAALARAQQRHAYDSAADLAAAYLFGIARGHPFADGNKRTALATALVFLALNGFEFEPSVTDDDAAGVVKEVASGVMTEDALASWIRSRSVPLTT